MSTFMAALGSGTAIMGDSFMTGLIMLVVVFAALVALALVIQMFGKMNASNKPAKAVVVSQPAPAPKAAPSSAIACAEDEDEVAAVIAAAVAMMAPAGVTYRVRRITPAAQRTRSEWAAAAVRQNTMPF